MWHLKFPTNIVFPFSLPLPLFPCNSIFTLCQHHKLVDISFLLTIFCRLSSQFFLSLACKMRWFPRSRCKCSMPKQLLITGNVSLSNFLLACIWILGWLVVMTIGEQFSGSFNNMFQRKKKTTHLKVALVIFQSSIALFCTDIYDFSSFWFFSCFQILGQGEIQGISSLEVLFNGSSRTRKLFSTLYWSCSNWKLSEELLSSKTFLQLFPFRFFCLVKFLLDLRHLTLGKYVKCFWCILYDFWHTGSISNLFYWLIVWNKKVH